LYRETGGFGGLLCMIYDYGAEEAHWNQSLELLTREVWPEFRSR
jgi:hypothetical protein